MNTEARFGPVDEGYGRRGMTGLMCEIGNAPGKGRVGGMITASDYEHSEGEAGLPPGVSPRTAGRIRMSDAAVPTPHINEQEEVRKRMTLLVGLPEHKFR